MRARFLGKIAVAVLLAASLSLPEFVSAEELAPGFDACMKKAKASDSRDVVWAKDKCFYAAKDYWNKILQKNYNEAKHRAEEKGYGKSELGYRTSSLLQFRWAFDKYLDACSGEFIGYDRYDIFIIEETKRMAQLMNTIYR